MTEPSKAKSRLTLFLKIAVTVFLLAYLLNTKGIDIRRSLEQLLHSNLLLVAVALLMLLAGQLICNHRWYQILRLLGIHLPVRRTLQFYLIGMFFSLFFPSIIGGDFIKMYYVRKESGKPMAYALASVYLDRAGGFLALLLYGVAGALLCPIHLTPQDFRPVGWFGLSRLPVVIIPAVFTLLFIAANILLVNASLFRLLERLLAALHLSNVSVRIMELHEALRLCFRRPAALLSPFIISLVNILMVILMNWLLALALDIEIPLAAMAATVPVMTLLVMLPVSINGIGLRENAFVILLQTVGVPPEKSFALSLLGFLLIVLSSLPGGICYSLLKKSDPLPPPDAMTAPPADGAD